ncbi:MAG TPA: cysteine hydrolase [Mycobacteriales bacterium]|nr:cysteine hydrolase [Mycobacteriales bacterium]
MSEQRPPRPKDLGELSSTAVLLIECQEGVLGTGSVLPDLADAARPIVPALARLAEGARAVGARLAHVTFEGLSWDYPAPRNAPLWRVAGAALGWGPGHPAAAVIAEVGVAPGDLVMPRHHGLNPMRGTEVLPVMRALGVTTLVVAGVSTNVAIPAVVTDAVNEGFRVVVPSDAVAGTPPEYSAAVVRHTLAVLATITTVDELLGHWGRPAD